MTVLPAQSGATETTGMTVPARTGATGMIVPARTEMTAKTVQAVPIGMTVPARIETTVRTVRDKTVTATTGVTAMRMKEILTGIRKTTVRITIARKAIGTIKESAAIVRKNRGTGLNKKSIK